MSVRLSVCVGKFMWICVCGCFDQLGNDATGTTERRPPFSSMGKSEGASVHRLVCVAAAWIDSHIRYLYSQNAGTLMGGYLWDGTGRLERYGSVQERPGSGPPSVTV